MKSGILAIAMLLLYFNGHAQEFKKDLTTVFAFQVHSMDDFFDRFNFRMNTGFRNFIKNNYPEYNISRAGLVASLLNSSNTSLFSDDARKFISEVTDSLKPQRLSYKDDNWYAELVCKVIYKGKPRNLALILKVEKLANQGYRWSVLSARADFLSAAVSLPDSLKLHEIQQHLKDGNLFNPKYSLSPVSHGIDFSNMDEMFLHKDHAFDYVNRNYHSEEVEKLILLIRKSAISFVHISKINYHLLQLENWVMVVEYVNRYDKNAGWRINKLMPVNQEQKEAYRKHQLTILKT